MSNYKFQKSEPDAQVLAATLREGGKRLESGETLEDESGLLYVPRKKVIGFEVFELSGRRLRMYNLVSVDEEKLAEDHIDGMRFEFVGTRRNLQSEVDNIELLLLHAMALSAKDTDSERYKKAVEAFEQSKVSA